MLPLILARHLALFSPKPVTREVPCPPNIEK